VTLGELILGTEKKLRAARLHYGHGTLNARDEAAYLVLRGLGLPFDSDLSRRIQGPDGRKIEGLVKARIEQRVPVAYLLKEAWLADHSFYVDHRVIIPRSHIAELLKGRAIRSVRPGRILDLCTGSGCLAILAALEFPRARVDAVDLSDEALEVARINIARYKLKDRVRLLKSDLFAAVAGEKYDLIVANPPYVDGAAMRALPREYRHEPRMALAGGTDGLVLVRQIIEGAKQHLRPGGRLVCEIGDGRRALERACPAARFTWPETAAGSDAVFVQAQPRRATAASR